MFRSTVIDVVDMIDYVLDGIELDMEGLETILEEGRDNAMIEENDVNMNENVNKRQNELYNEYNCKRIRISI